MTENNEADNTIELYGGPLDGLFIEIPVKLVKAAVEIRIPYNSEKEGMLEPEKDIGPQFEGTQAVYIRMVDNENRYLFKETNATDTSSDYESK